MLKRKIASYIREFYNNSRNALLITGARQTGKTYSIREFGKTFKNFVEINFVDMPEAVNVFAGAKTATIYCYACLPLRGLHSSREKRLCFSMKYRNALT